MNPLPHRLDRTVVIDAPRDVVFEFFTDNGRWSDWWGSGSTIDPRPGGRVYIRYPNGVEVSGEVVEAVAPDRIVFTYGFASGQPIAPGASLVTIRLAAQGQGTALTLTHEFAEAPARDQHVQGWRYQLSVFGNVVANRLHANAAELIDQWFDAWADNDSTRRGQALSAIANPNVTFRDRYSLVDGLADLAPHINAYQHFMPDIRMKRAGEVRHCQGTVLADWTAATADGQPRGRGTNVFRLGADGKIAAVTGLWG
jgi:uncharacterized protein YndB with AHSA1/START domain